MKGLEDYNLLRVRRVQMITASELNSERGVFFIFGMAIGAALVLFVTC